MTSPAVAVPLASRSVTSSMTGGQNVMPEPNCTDTKGTVTRYRVKLNASVGTPLAGSGILIPPLPLGNVTLYPETVPQHRAYGYGCPLTGIKA